MYVFFQAGKFVAGLKANRLLSQRYKSQSKKGLKNITRHEVIHLCAICQCVFVVG